MYPHNVFNPHHRAYQSEVWNVLMDNIKLIKDNIGHKITPIDVGVIKRSLFTTMFFTGSSSDVIDDDFCDPDFDSISYNPHERLDKFDGLTKAFASFASIGVGSSCNISFNEWMNLPFWLTEWIEREWVPLTKSTDTNLEDKLDAEMRKMERAVK